jgi:hypothetical protein
MARVRGRSGLSLQQPSLQSQFFPVLIFATLPARGSSGAARSLVLRFGSCFFASPHRVLFHLVVVIFLLTSFSVLCQSPFPAQLAARDFLLRTKRDQVQSSRFGCLTKCCQALIVYLNWLQFFDFFCEWIVAGGRRSILELPD